MVPDKDRCVQSDFKRICKFLFGHNDCRTGRIRSAFYLKKIGMAWLKKKWRYWNKLCVLAKSGETASRTKKTTFGNCCLKLIGDTHTARRKKYETTFRERRQPNSENGIRYGAERQWALFCKVKWSRWQNKFILSWKGNLLAIAKPLFQSDRTVDKCRKISCKREGKEALFSTLWIIRWTNDGGCRMSLRKYEIWKPKENSTDCMLYQPDNPGDELLRCVECILQPCMLPNPIPRCYRHCLVGSGDEQKAVVSQTFQNFPRLEYEDLILREICFVRISGEGDAFIGINGEQSATWKYNKGLEEFKPL